MLTVQNSLSSPKLDTIVTAYSSTTLPTTSNNQGFFFNQPLIYSEPALLNLVNSTAYTNVVSSAYSEAALANVCFLFKYKLFDNCAVYQNTLFW